MIKPPKYLLAALMSGNLLEYFDFFIFAHFSFLLAPKFYPSINPLYDALIGGFFFAIGFLARPLGGYIFGRLADLDGRRRSLMFSVLGMAIPTLCIGLLPTYAEVGIAAPIALITCRIIQGLCVGGEFTNGGILLIESYGWQRAGTVSGLYNASGGMGSLLAIGCVAVVTLPGMPEWAWRIPFIIAAVMGVIAYYLRSYVCESSIFEKEIKKQSSRSFKLLNATHRGYVLRAFCVGAISGVFVWIPLSYTSFYMTKILSIPLHSAVKMTVLAVISHNILTAFFGWLSDRIGPKNTMLIGCLFQVVCIYPAFWLLRHQHFVLFQLIMVIPAALAYSVVHSLSLLDVPVLIRGRLSGFAFSAGLSIFAGLTPMITNSLTQFMGGSTLGVVYYVGVVALLGWFILMQMFRHTNIRSQTGGTFA